MARMEQAKLARIMNIFVMSWKATLLGQVGYFWPAGHTLPTTALDSATTQQPVKNNCK